MNQPAVAASRIERPTEHFAEAHDVVLAPLLSHVQKTDMLDTLEQDARQLSQASSDGMEGGEPSRLQDVLGAREALAESAMPNMYETVIQDLRYRREIEMIPAARRVLEETIAALTAFAPSMATYPRG